MRRVGLFAVMLLAVFAYSFAFVSPSYAADKKEDIAAAATKECKSIKDSDSKKQTARRKTCEKGYVEAATNGIKEDASKEKTCKDDKDCGNGYIAGFKKYEAAQVKAKAEATKATTSDKKRNILGTPAELNIPALGITHVASNIVSILSFIVGFISVIFIAIAGVKYSASNGNPAQIQSAKQTLTYAVTGLVVSLMAYGIVGFVLSRGPN